MTAEDRQDDNQISGESERASGSPGAAEPPAPWLVWTGLSGIVLVTLATGIGRLLRLDSYPGGLAEAEAAHGVLARQSGEFGLQWAIENAGTLSIPLMIVISWVGSVTGFDVATPRIAAALFGAASILCTGLWLHRAMGPLWGFAGAAVLAGSFWHILFSRLANGQIAGAFALAALCWFLTEAAPRRGPQAMPWYGLAGLAAGIGFLSAPALRLLPLILLSALIVALFRLRQQPEHSEARNWLVSSAIVYLTISPFLIANRGDWQLWTPWASTPGLPGDDPANLVTLPGAIIDTALALFLPGDGDTTLNLPDDPWFSLLMLPWAAVGLLGIIHASNNPALRDRFLVGLGITLAAWIGISARDAGHPGQLVVISPALGAIATYGFRTILRWARVRVVRVALAGLVVVGIAGNAVVSTQQYATDWVTDPDTEVAFHADVTDTLLMIEALETSEPVFLSLSDRETLLDYFRTTARLHTFDGQSVLPFPADEDGYLIVPDSEPLAVELAQLLDQSGSGTSALDADSYRGYRLDARIREEMPLSAPTIPYPNGPVLYGSSDPSRGAVEGSVRFLVAWRSSLESPAFQIEARLQTAVSPREETATITTLPSNPLGSGLFQIVVIEIEIPTHEVPSDFQIRLRRENGTIVPVAGMDTEGYLLLNRYVFEE